MIHGKIYYQIIIGSAGNRTESSVKLFLETSSACE